jgi:aminocarboxymuconate-semialdehyde decarboxylase
MESAAAPGAIDLHSHIVTAEVLALLERDGAHFDTRIVERDGQRFFLIAETTTRPINARVIGLDDAAARLTDMDSEGIERAALTCVPFVLYPGVAAERALAIAQTHNDSVASLVARRRDRFVGLASVPLQAPSLAVGELERAHKRGLVGVMISPTIQGQTLDMPEFEGFWDAAEALNMLVFIHPFDAAPVGLLARYGLGNLVGNLTDTGLAAAAIICGGVLERHPRLRVLLAHCGGTLPAMLGRMDDGFTRFAEARSRISRPPSTYLSQLWMDTIAFSQLFQRSLVALFGADRFVLGSDYPVGGPPHPVAEVQSLGLSPGDAERVLRENALGLLARGD